MSIFLNKKILIYGLGRSGLSTSQFLKNKCDVFLYDDFKRNLTKSTTQRFIIKNKFDYVVLLHGDGQYAPELIEQLLEKIENDGAGAIFGSRMMEKGSALKGGMPFYKLSLIHI